MIVKLKSKNPRYPDLSEEQQYFVLGIEADDYRILNDVGKPYLYSPELFDVIDPTEPADWVTEFGEDGERYSYPTPLNEAGFFEDFFDQKPGQTSVFWHVVNQRLAHAA
ncbi:MAG: hypothetical protein U9Q81_20320 [Pseudomonadota bacterium]|nr:hypothetical protein [Pseudomonadota bacterium]